MKIYFKPSLRKQRSFQRSSSSGITCFSGSSSSGPLTKSKPKRSLTFTTALDEVYREIEVMKQLNHPHAIRLYEVIDDPTKDNLYLVMPLADYGECMKFDKASGRFKPNPMIQAVNVNKAHKQLPKECEFYDE